MSAIRYIIVSVTSGILFGILDGVINANPLAQRIYAVYKPIAKASLNVSAGMLIDLAYGFIMAALFLLLYKGLPGRTALVKGMSFGLQAWFFRVVMCTASQWMMFNAPGEALLYPLAAGFVEMIILGLLYGLTLKTAN
ncbi:MAG: hypothetical protein H6Q04_3226 [Acidobacteria bacterium]|jgi:hypothetical protein|nr:hypothetical protein [Acidobacteriota bacterium]